MRRRRLSRRYNINEFRHSYCKYSRRNYRRVSRGGICI